MYIIILDLSLYIIVNNLISCMNPSQIQGRLKKKIKSKSELFKIIFLGQSKLFKTLFAQNNEKLCSKFAQ